MKNLWKVTFDVKYTHCKEPLDEEVKVVANGDGMSAINKAKRKFIGSSFSGATHVHRCVWVKLKGLELIAEIDA